MGFAHRAFVAAGVGFAVSAIVGCGSSGGSWLTASEANNLSLDLNRVTQALDNQQCSQARQYLAAFQSNVNSLGGVNSTLVSNLDQGASTIQSLANRDCHVPAATKPKKAHPKTTTSTTTTATRTVQTFTNPTTPTYSTPTYTQPTYSNTDTSTTGGTCPTCATTTATNTTPSTTTSNGGTGLGGTTYTSTGSGTTTTAATGTTGTSGGGY